MSILSGFSKAIKSLKKDPSDRSSQIEFHEARIRAINDDLNAMIVKIRELEAQMKDLFTRYDLATGASKDTYKVQILSLKKRIDGMKETRDLYSRNLEKENLIIQKLEFVGKASTTPIDSDEIEGLMDDITDANLDLQVEDQTLDALKNSTYVQKKTTPRQATTGMTRSVQAGKTNQSDLVSGSDSASEQNSDDLLMDQLRAELNQEEV